MPYDGTYAPQNDLSTTTHTSILHHLSQGLPSSRYIALCLQNYLKLGATGQSRIFDKSNLGKGSSYTGRKRAVTRVGRVQLYLPL